MLHPASTSSALPHRPLAHITTPDPGKIQLIHDLIGQGYEVVPTRPDNPKRPVRSDSKRVRYDTIHFMGGEGVAIRTGQQGDGSFLVRIDIDQHADKQNAEAVFQAIATALGSAFDKCAVKRSTNGQGYDVLLKCQVSLPNNRHFDYAGVHAGEIFCDGGYVGVPTDGNWLWGSLFDLAMLSEAELQQLLSIISFTTNVTDRVSWSERAREGQRLIRGWRDVNTPKFLEAYGMPKAFSGSDRKHLISQSNWRKLQAATKGERSEAVANFLQSLFWVAPISYGASVEERCRTIAAIAIEADPRAKQEGRDIEKDIAALIARILNGDQRQYSNNCFTTPNWALEYQPAPKQAKGRPKGDRYSQIAKLRLLLLKNAEGDEVYRLGRNKLTVAILGEKLGVQERTVQTYLATLEQNREIVREQDGGRGGGLKITLMPMFNSAKTN